MNIHHYSINLLSWPWNPSRIRRGHAGLFGYCCAKYMYSHSLLSHMWYSLISLVNYVIVGKKFLIPASVNLLTTLKQELRGDSGEENRESQLTGLLAALEMCSITPRGFTQSGFIWRQKNSLQLRTEYFHTHKLFLCIDLIHKLCQSLMCPTCQPYKNPCMFSAGNPSGKRKSFPASLSFVPNRPMDVPVWIQTCY